ncbi:MAG: M3 family metallopeptidase, partial [Silvibacterium sp.]
MIRSVKALSTALIVSAAFMTSTVLAQSTSAFAPSNPFYATSTLPFHAPPFDKIKDSDYQPAIEAGMAQQLEEIRAIADNPAPPTFENTLVAMEKTGALFRRATAAFDGVTGANTNPTLQKAEEALAPLIAAHSDAIYLNSRLFARVQAVYNQRESLKLDPESQRLLEIVYQRFVHAGANLSDADKASLKKLNQEESTLSNSFKNKLLAATRDAALTTPDKAALAGLSDAQIASAAQAAKTRDQRGYVIPLQNTTQQPSLTSLSDRTTRQTLFDNSWTRAERGGVNDTRATIARLAQLRTEKAKLLGFPNYAAWKLENQMAKTPQAALKFMDDLVPPATANAQSEAKEIQSVIDAQKA